MTGGRKKCTDFEARKNSSRQKLKYYFLHYLNFGICKIKKYAVFKKNVFTKYFKLGKVYTFFDFQKKTEIIIFELQEFQNFCEV